MEERRRNKAVLEEQLFSASWGYAVRGIQAVSGMWERRWPNRASADMSPLAQSLWSAKAHS